LRERSELLAFVNRDLEISNAFPGAILIVEDRLDFGRVLNVSIWRSASLTAQ
jgi:hypothetical protein